MGRPECSHEGDASLSGYPAFPDSASVYSNSVQHEGTSSAAPSSDATVVLGNIPMGLPNGHAPESMPKHADPRHSQLLQAQQYDQYLRQQRQGSGQMHGSDYDGHGAFVPSAGPHPGRDTQGYLPAAASSGDLSQKYDSNASNETVGSRDKERRRSKGWVWVPCSEMPEQADLSLSMAMMQPARRPSNGVASVNVPGNGSHQSSGHLWNLHRLSASLPNTRMLRSPVSPTLLRPSRSIPRRPRKKPKRRLERPRRPDARRNRRRLVTERVRVMQKRNQLLASSNSKDSVEWLSGSIQAEEPYRIESQRKGARQATCLARLATLAVDAKLCSREIPALATPSTHPQPPQPRLWHERESSRGRQHGLARRGCAIYSRSNKARRREFDDDHSMSSFEDAVEPRRANYAPSIQSYQTGDSDPGPGTTQQVPQGHHIQRASSSSSLASAPPVIDHRRFAPSLESHRSSTETRSISSLDHQLIANMERMTAAQRLARVRRQCFARPRPHCWPEAVAEPSKSDQQPRFVDVRTSTGSASPLHHASGIPASTHTRTGAGDASAGYHPPYQLPPLHQSLQQQQAGAQRSDTGPDAFYPNGSYPQQHMQQHHVNPIFHVAPGNSSAMAPRFRLFVDRSIHRRACDRRQSDADALCTGTPQRRLAAELNGRCAAVYLRSFALVILNLTIVFLV